MAAIQLLSTVNTEDLMYFVLCTFYSDKTFFNFYIRFILPLKATRELVLLMDKSKEL